MSVSSLSSSPSPSHIRVRDPLSEVTRKERRALLAVALLGITIRRTGLLPTEVEALGLKFASSDHRALLQILAVVTAYFLVAFILYAASDFLAWRLALRESIRDAIARRKKQDDLDNEAERDLHHEMRRRYPFLSVNVFLVNWVSIARAIFEFVLPVAFGAFAVWVVLRGGAP